MSKWSLFKENGKSVIRRWENGKYLRLPLKQYQHIRDNDEELKAFVIRLNARFICVEAVTFKHAFISPALVDEYRELLEAQIPTKKNALCQHNYLIKYFLNYFIGELNLADPRQWYAVHKTKWANYLLKEDLSVSTIRKIVQEANRFMEWLGDKRPGEATAIRFKPLSRAKMTSMTAKVKMDESIRYIRPEEWVKIEDKIPENIKAAACLCYYFGLRRSEALGLEPRDVRKEHLRIERQKLKLNEPSVLKGRKNRKTPYWFGITPKKTYELISKVVPMSPDTLGDEWGKFCKKFTLHDLRHTFITRAMSEHKPREVQLAVGHENIATTMRYSHDHRDLGDDLYTPDNVA